LFTAILKGIYTNMKKTVTTLSLIAANVAIAFAQINGTINIGQTAAQGQVNGGALISLLTLVSKLSGMAAPMLVTAAVLVFFWFVIQFIIKGNQDAEAKQASVKGMMYSVGAIFVMVSIWGIVGFLGNLLGINQGGAIPVPAVPTFQ
jgi:hypothetical protein